MRSGLDEEAASLGDIALRPIKAVERRPRESRFQLKARSKTRLPKLFQLRHRPANEVQSTADPATRICLRSSRPRSAMAAVLRQEPRELGFHRVRRGPEGLARIRPKVASAVRCHVNER